MLPIGPLMIEHRLIEKMIHLMSQEIIRIKANIAISPQFAFVEPRFIDAAADFIQTYADQVHHGKEEDILFVALGKKSLSSEHLKIMQELQQDHKWGRETTASLMAAQKKFVQGNAESLADILESMTALVEFYPKHIVKEDKLFFLPMMAYFSPTEKDALLAQMAEFDRGFIHAKYEKMVANWAASGCKCHL